MASLHPAAVLQENFLRLLDVRRRDPAERLALATLGGEVSERELEDAKSHGTVERRRPLEQRVDRPGRVLLRCVEGFLSGGDESLHDRISGAGEAIGSQEDLHRDTETRRNSEFPEP